CDGYCATAVARATCFAGIGIDAEVNDALPNDVLTLVSNDLERKKIKALPKQEIAWDRVLFSIKESIYKAVFPIIQRWLGFEDASVTIYPRKATFRATLSIEDSIRTICGRFIVSDGQVITVAVFARFTNRP